MSRKLAEHRQAACLDMQDSTEPPCSHTCQAPDSALSLDDGGCGIFACNAQLDASSFGEVGAAPLVQSVGSRLPGER
jgi:hypothetical protein